MAKFHIIALEALLSSPPVVSSFFDDVHLLVAVLSHVSAEYPASAVAAHRVAAVHGASPHVSDPVRKHLWPSPRVTDERVVGGDPVRPSTGAPPSIHINAESFSQQSAPGLKKVISNVKPEAMTIMIMSFSK